ncbi:MAG: tetratricopeptide repeat protein [Promethearchaeota archaeon]
MSIPTSVDFELAEDLIDKGKKEEALEFVKKFARSAISLNQQGDADEALEIAFKCQDLLLKIGSEKYLANNYLMIGRIYRGRLNIEPALKLANKALGIHQRLRNRRGIASSLNLLGNLYWDQRDHERALRFIEQSLSIDEISPEVKLDILSGLGGAYLIWGELSKALNYCEEAIEFVKETNLIYFCPHNLYIIGAIYLMMGDYERSEVFLHKSLTLIDKLKWKTVQKGLTLVVLIWLELSRNFDEEAKKYLTLLKNFTDQSKSIELLPEIFSIGKGMILQKSSKLRDRAEAERLLKEVVDGEIYNIRFGRDYIYPYALYFLCDFLVEELGISNDIGLIPEINSYISKLDDLGDEHNSYLYRTEATLLQARLALIQLNLGEARILLTQAQEMAETHNLQYFAKIISSNHDRLLEQQDLLEELKKTNSPISERIKYASLDGVLSRLKEKSSTESSEIINETPILLLIISKGGILICSKTYSETLSVDSDLISSFLSAFESFGDELFAERLDRIKYGENTIIMKPLENFSVCYLFKGQSYPALHKLTRFTEVITEDSEIWQILSNAVKTGEMLELDRNPSLKSVIDEIFIS